MAPIHHVCVDISAFVYRAAWGVVCDSPRVSTTSVQKAVDAFERHIESVFQATRPTHRVLVADAGYSGRTLLYPAYKATRAKGRDPVLYETVQSVCPRIADLCARRAWTYLEVPGYEADDVMATYATRVRNARGYVTAVNPDKDALQLVERRIRVGAPELRRPWHKTDQDVYETLKVTAPRVADYLALVGDQADNLPGVRGIGPKYAERLLADRSLLEILDSPPQTPQEELIHANREQALLMLQLTTLQRDVPIPFAES